MFDQVKVAAVSFTPIKFDVEANVNKLQKLFRRAGRREAKLALAPEGAIEGYVVNEILEGCSRASRMLDAVNGLIESEQTKAP